MIQRKCIKYFLCGSIFFSYAGTGFALSSDSQKTCHISAKQIIFEQKSHTITYLGDVIATQGSTQLYGDKLVFYLNKQNQLLKMIDYGNPAKYSSLPHAKGHRLYAQAKIINYDVKHHTVLLLHDGRITQNHDMFYGPHILYNTAQGVVLSTTDSSKQRTVIILTPENHIKQ
jgi:lipopolysaccharide export system protein LptA